MNSSEVVDGGYEQSFLLSSLTSRSASVFWSGETNQLYLNSGYISFSMIFTLGEIQQPKIENILHSFSNIL